MKKLQGIIIVVSILFMFSLILNQWSEIESLDTYINYNLLFLSFIFLILLFFLDAVGWYLILRAMGNKPPLPETIRIWLLSSITRYLPGGIWAYASRASMSRELGVDIKSSVISMYIETILLIASSFVVGLPALLSYTKLAEYTWLFIAVIPVCGFLLHPRLLSVLKLFPGETARKLGSLTLLSAKLSFLLYLYYVFFWILFGLVFICFVGAVYPISINDWVIIGSSIALGFLLGFIVIFFPSGIGIRESAIYVLLLPIIPSTVCLVVSIGSRIWLVVSEMISTLISALIVLKKNKINLV